MIDKIPQLHVHQSTVTTPYHLYLSTCTVYGALLSHGEVGELLHQLESLVTAHEQREVQLETIILVEDRNSATSYFARVFNSLLKQHKVELQQKPFK